MKVGGAVEERSEDGEVMRREGLVGLGPGLSLGLETVFLPLKNDPICPGKVEPVTSVVEPCVYHQGAPFSR